MAYLSGLKKQINKANQFMTERISGVEGTKLDDDFYVMEKKSDLIVELVDDLQIKTKEYLQPNPTVRAKMAAVKGISKLSGQAKASTYPQPEGTLGEAMLTYGNKLQEYDRESIFGSSLVESGEALKSMADLKYALDDNVKQNYLEPLHHLQSKDLKEVSHHRKKLQGRKLDYDCKKRQGVTDKELKQAEDKFAESLHLAQMGMFNILEADIEQISQLMQFAEAMLEYHRQCSEILQGLSETLYTKTQAASGRQRREFVPKTLEDLGIETSCDLSMTAPHLERQLRGSSSNRPRSEVPRSSSTARSASSHSLSSNSSSHPRPNSQPNFNNHQLQDLDPWDSAEHSATAPPPPPSQSKSGAGWTVFPDNSPAAAPRAAWGKPKPSKSSPMYPNINNNAFNNGYKSNIPSGTLISTSPGASPAGTPTHGGGASAFSSGFNSGVASPARYTPSSTPTKLSQPTCQALYDFEPENSGELGFKEGDMITLKQKVDDNWFEGTFQGKTGFFPINYVSVLVPLP